MKCYNHNDIDALGTCKACNKGVCKDCLTDVGNGIACSKACVEEVRGVNELIAKNKDTYKNISKKYINAGFFYAGLGLLFIILNIYFNNNNQFFFMLSFFIMALGLYNIFTGYSKNK